MGLAIAHTCACRKLIYADMGREGYEMVNICRNGERWRVLKWSIYACIGLKWMARHIVSNCNTGESSNQTLSDYIFILDSKLFKYYSSAPK